MPTFSFARRIARRLRALWRRRTAVIELTEAEKRFLSTREQILLRRNPQLLLQEMRELDQNDPEELDAYLAPISTSPVKDAKPVRKLADGG